MRLARVINLGLAVVCTFLLIGVLLAAHDAFADMATPLICREASKAYCPRPEGFEGEIRLRVEGGDFAVGDTPDLNCVDTTGTNVSPPLTLTYVPEPRGQLLVGLVGLLFLGVNNGRCE